MTTKLLLGKALAAAALIALFLFSPLAYAHQLTEIRGKPNSAALYPVIKAAQSLARKNKAVVWSAYRIVEIGPIKENEKEEETISRVIRFSLHRDFVVKGIPDKYEFSVLTHAPSFEELQAFKQTLPELTDETSGFGSKRFDNLLDRAIEKNLWVFVGQGNGEKTSAEVITFFDSATAEYVYIVNSNFGLGSAKRKKP